MKFHKISLLLLVVFISCQYQKGSKNQEKVRLDTNLIKTIEKRIAEGVTPSMALAIIDSSGIHYFNFGKTDNNGKAVDENTIYEIGSITKVFTGIILAKLVLDGDLKIDDKINDLLPDGIKVPVKGDKEITLGNLTDHTSGLPPMPDNFAPTNPKNPFADYTVEQMYKFISNYKPVREVGSQFEYSNLAQGLLGHLLALKKNTTYEDLMVKTIADPLGMNDTRIVFTEKMKENLALGHSWGKVVENWDIPTLAGAGGIRSSTADMAKFISANLGYTKTPLNEAMELSHKIRHNKAGEMSVAMGWLIKKRNYWNIIWHSGGTGGYRTFVGFVKETGKGVVLLTNSSYGADDIGFYLLDPDLELARIKFKSDAVQLPDSTLERYIGIYEVNPKFKITITKEGTQLIGKSTTGPDRVEIYPENDTRFFTTVKNAEVTFQLNEGNVESLTLYQDGQKMIGKKIK
jgi:serine-type D-Ala-D-Ala carboxypeptidase/endopeptidase